MTAKGPASGAEIAQRRQNRDEIRERRRLRLRRRSRRAYIRSVYFLPSMATLGNAICGFGAMYLAVHREYSSGAYLIFLAMVFDALDGRLARFARHTTDFGGQLDSLADVISFGTAPAFLSLMLLMNSYGTGVPVVLSRLIFSIGALFMSCAALRLARFNVSNEHGEQHHFSFLGLPSPAAGGTVAAWILMQQWFSHFVDELQSTNPSSGFLHLLSTLSTICIVMLPAIVFSTGLLMISHIRYPHLVNRYLRGRRSIGRLIMVLVGLLFLLALAHQLVIAVVMVTYVLWGAASAANRYWRMRAV